MSYTPEQQFGIHKKTGHLVGQKKPTRGDLYCVLKGREYEIPGCTDQPFAFCNFMKRQLVATQGYDPKTLKIRYHVS